uniref:Uncharacterized protein n=1 Tax=Candidatus Kentrum sp. TC TaxID=2126339 RepID=A0A450ZNS1_9GAMM|nr:MAG: hypothetical protein BECKTC1821F_GA0114240_10077 [Candidatus Kentron sp. TC]
MTLAWPSDASRPARADSSVGKELLTGLCHGAACEVTTLPTFRHIFRHRLEPIGGCRPGGWWAIGCLFRMRLLGYRKAAAWGISFRPGQLSPMPSSSGAGPKNPGSWKPETTSRRVSGNPSATGVSGDAGEKADVNQRHPSNDDTLLHRYRSRSRVALA